MWGAKGREEKEVMTGKVSRIYCFSSTISSFPFIIIIIIVIITVIIIVVVVIIVIIIKSGFFFFFPILFS